MKTPFRFRQILSAVAFLTALLFASASAFADAGFGHARLFNDNWKFQLFENKDSLSASNPDFDDSKWRSLNLPHDWSIEAQLSPSLASCTGYLPGGIGWYRKNFTISDTAEKHYLYFEGVYNRSEVYVNGHLLGKRPNGYISFLYDITPWLKQGENTVAVRVDHSRYADSRYYTGSGIYRDVYLISAPATHFSLWGVGYKTTRLTDKKADLKVDVAIENPHPGMKIMLTLRDASGKTVASASTATSKANNLINLSVKNPHRWNLDDPYLYTLQTVLTKNGSPLDTSVTTVGLRSLKFTADKGFALNGENMKVKGVCLHHDAGTLGSVVPRQVWKRRIENLKKLGVNAIRMSHNPQAPVVYDLCDQLGMLVMDEASDEWEFPKRKWVKGWNKGEPSFDGAYDFFEEWIDRDVADMVRRDRNHPSVFLWSIGNEVDYPNDPYSHPVLDGTTISQPMFGGYNPDAPDAMRIGKIAKRLAGIVKGIDDSRPTTGALAGVVMSNETEYPQAVDIVGYNYTEDRYDVDHATYPDRVIYGSENRSDYDAWRAVKDRDFIFGQFIWTGADYLGESGAWPSRGLYTGLLDFGSFPKPRGYFRASLWSDSPMAYIGTYPMRKEADNRQGRPWLSIDAWDNWNYDPDQLIRVVCYTNAPQARLLLNGKPVGDMKPYDEKTGVIYWDIPFAPGVLKAEGCDMQGNAIAEYEIRTSGRPYELRVSSDVNDIDAENPVAHLVVEIFDEDGNKVLLGDNEITCRIEGPAQLLGLEGSNNSDMSDYTDNRHRAFRGRLLAYVKYDPQAKQHNSRDLRRGPNAPAAKTADPDAPIKITFTSPLLKPTTITLNEN